MDYHVTEELHSLKTKLGTQQGGHGSSRQEGAPDCTVEQRDNCIYSLAHYYLRGTEQHTQGITCHFSRTDVSLQLSYCLKILVKCIY